MHHRRFAFFALVPAFSLLLAISLVSTGGAIYFALLNRSLRSPKASFVGLANFERLLSDQRFHHAIGVSLLWEAVTVIGTLALAILLAVFLEEKVRSRKARLVLSLAFLAPVLMPRVAVAFMWRQLYSPSIGLFDWALGLVGIPPVEFLADPRLALASVAAVDVWQWGLFFAVILAELMASLPRAPIEAAMLDKAKTWEIYAHVVLPMLRAPLVSLTLVKAIESLRSFDLIYVMTGGGPGSATETLDLYAYQVGINMSGRVSYASAMSLVLLVATIVVFTLIWRRVGSWSH